MKHVMLSVSVLVMAAVSVSPSAQAKPTEYSKYVKVFNGREGVVVKLLLAKEKKEALIQVSGIETPIDGLVLSCDIENGSLGKVDFKTMLKGKRWHLMRRKESGWGAGTVVWIPNPPGQGPGRSKKMGLSYDSKASKNAAAQQLIALHEKQKKDGSLKKVQ